MNVDKETSSSKTPGTVFLIGAGPGDPGLITVKGLEKIRQADVLIYDYLADPNLIGEARPDAEVIYVGKKGKDHTVEQGGINELLVRKAREAHIVVRLKGGDPYVFGRGGEEAQELSKAGIPFEIVPGVTSAVAAPAYAGIPVTHRDHASMVTFITGHESPEKRESAIDWEVLAKNPGTLIFLMGVKNLPNISKSLIENGKPGSTPAALVRWGTTPKQVSLISTLAEIPEEAARRGIAAPAIFVVGSVASLNQSLGWYEQKTLFGKKVLITRSRAQSRQMSERIRELGGDPILFPTIQIAPPDDFGPLDNAIHRISSFDWVVFTSVNGVDRFFQRYFEVKSDIRDMAGPRIGAIGPVTAASIRRHGLSVDLLAKKFVAEGILELLSEEDVRNMKFLIPRAARARDILPDELRRLGGEVEVVPVYRTIPPDDADIADTREMLKRGEIDAITFTSSSTFTHFLEMMKGIDLQQDLGSVVLASIGPITSETIRENGLTPTVEASEYTIDGLVEALVGHMGEGKK
jgi:uroporphyrinogen III methyltransferase / synthase